ncbi:vacuolar protein sorting-associated protein VTA1 homolog isoform X1 [Hylaeus anthracinus]|uniref:vacuolar protein sorting-associated protein VTA1 homolog isoform X1 n=1 Tax=Hylaeus anthracinus TaxID=313031 RepID=UPI0023B8CF21|nr:vacuolar protein sorting-associated protein VTA1 homolog isoform X1 [Hylaeus anthracinus]XP_054008615.1 vacuolar protein sorting-associated protein VTA1 homolog isoform X1 [Hylaeus anthracinus]
MAGPDLPEIPPPLKSLQQSLKIASTHDQRDPVVSYWCRLYALQRGLKLSTKTPEETNFLLKLIDWLETTKKESRDNEAITNDIAAQAHLENWALKLFLYADENDRASNFGKNVVQSFFTAGILYDVLTVFGELTEEAAQNRKYAKWKAAYIHNCLKNGETPVPGPIDDNTENIDSGKTMDEESVNTPTSPKTKEGEELLNTNTDGSIDSSNTDSFDTPRNPISTGNIGQWSSELKEDYDASTRTEGGVELSLEQMNKAQKFIKWAGSALNYDDVPTAVSNLRKALHLLTTGEELA